MIDNIYAGKKCIVSNLIVKTIQNRGLRSDVQNCIQLTGVIKQNFNLIFYNILVLKKITVLLHKNAEVIYALWGNIEQNEIEL